MCMALRVFLVLLVSSEVCGQRCVSSMQEVGHPVTIIRPVIPVTYYQAIEMCHEKRGFGLLFFTDNLIDLELASTSCPGGGGLVPLDISRGSTGLPVPSDSRSLEEPYEEELQDITNLMFNIQAIHKTFKKEGTLSQETVQRLKASKDEESADEQSPFSGFLDYFLPSKIGAFNLATKRWHYVLVTHFFQCVLCQRLGIALQLPPQKHAYAEKSNFTELSYFQIIVTRFGESSLGNFTEDEIYTVPNALAVLLQSYWVGPLKPRFIRVMTNGTSLEFGIHAHILLTVAFSTEPVPLLDIYKVSVNDVGFCPLEETTDVNGEVTVWKPLSAYSIIIPAGTFQRQKNSISGAILRRECFFDDSTYRASWSAVSYWQPAWKPCSEDMVYYNEEIYKDLLGDDVRYRHSHQLERFIATTTDSTTLEKVAVIVDNQVDRFNEVDEVMSQELLNITSSLLFDGDKDVCLVQETRVYLLVSGLTGKAPVLGLTLSFPDKSDAGNLSIRLDREQMTEPILNQQFSLSISDKLVAAHKRMMVFVYWIEIPTPRNQVILLAEHRKTQYIEATVALVLKSEQRADSLYYGRDSEYYVDVTFKPQSDVFLLTFTITVMVCSAWNHELGAWVTAGCHTLKAARGDLVVCRCSAKYFTLNENTRGVATARYALNKLYETNIGASPFLAFLGDNTALIVATVLECILSSLGLCSIICTAIFFKTWRKNTGHVILLHMILALTCNLVLGFTTSFVHLSTESVGCLALGVLRHYSFLAMFLWMLVLSGLQLKRLTTVAGAKTINHLILKVALFAWGVPLIPITVLLAWNPRFYKSDRFDRGYCYPEKLVFELTVQAPAGIILVINLFIFIAILTRIFECRGEKITRHSKNKKAEQLNKFKTSVFIFFLFGFTWVFHFLSEEKVIVSDFFFEYLFLMTATTHIAVLALFFIVFQEKTRKDWVSLITKLISGGSTIPAALVAKPKHLYRPRLAKARVRRPQPTQVSIALE